MGGLFVGVGILRRARPLDRPVVARCHRVDSHPVGSADLRARMARMVPLFPFAQPIFTLQQPYWIGLLVHSSSAIVYPLFFWLRWPDALARQAFLRFWLIGVLSVLVALGCLALASTQGYEIAWFGHDKLSDQTYMRHMRTHHEQGIDLASIAAGRVNDPHLRALAKLMAASQK